MPHALILALALLASPDPRHALDTLLAQPLDAKTTVSWHVAVARAAKAADSALWASRALMVLELYLKPSPAPDLADVKRWLAEKGLKHHRLALDALGRGDEAAAAKEYLLAVRCDQSVLGFENRRLRERSMTVLDGLVRAHSADPQYWGHLAYYSYFYGKLDQARDALEHGLALQKDPYLRWVYEEGQKVLDGERARAAAPPPPPDPVARDYAQARREQIETELKRVFPCPKPLKEQLSADLKSAVLEATGFKVGY